MRELLYQSSFSVANILAAATKVRNYVNSYKRLPETVTVGSYKISIEEFSYLMSETIIGLNKGSISSVSTLEGIQDVESGGDSMNAKIYKEQYVDLANRAMTYIQNNKVPATCIHIVLQKYWYSMMLINTCLTTALLKAAYLKAVPTIVSPFFQM